MPFLQSEKSLLVFAVVASRTKNFTTPSTKIRVYKKVGRFVRSLVRSYRVFCLRFPIIRRIPSGSEGSPTLDLQVAHSAPLCRIRYGVFFRLYFFIFFSIFVWWLEAQKKEMENKNLFYEPLYGMTKRVFTNDAFPYPSWTLTSLEVCRVRLA